MGVSLKVHVRLYQYFRYAAATVASVSRHSAAHHTCRRAVDPAAGLDGCRRRLQRSAAATVAVRRRRQGDPRRVRSLLRRVPARLPLLSDRHSHPPTALHLISQGKRAAEFY